MGLNTDHVTCLKTVSSLKNRDNNLSLPLTINVENMYTMLIFYSMFLARTDYEKKNVSSPFLFYGKL